MKPTLIGTLLVYFITVASFCTYGQNQPPADQTPTFYEMRDAYLNSPQFDPEEEGDGFTKGFQRWYAALRNLLL